MEVWKDIENYEGLYQVSNLGNIKSLERYSMRSGKRYQLIPSRIRILTPDPKGYLKVNLIRNGSKCFLVHRLVATAFLTKDNDLLVEVNHKDLNKSNNVMENLEWCTGSENTKHAFANRYIKRPKGSESYRSKITEQDSIDIRELYKTGNYSYKDIAAIYGVGYNLIGYVIRGYTWKHTQTVSDESTTN